MIGALIKSFRLARLKRQGLQIAEDCRLLGMPNWGSEPYLISIGRHVTISGRVTFINHDGGTWVFRDKEEFREVIKFGRITIHENCFIGFGVTILPGVEIGPNSVVAAGALVTKSVPPSSVVAGVPARVLMKVDDYANSCAKNTPNYDRAAYSANKRAELVRLYPRPW